MLPVSSTMRSFTRSMPRRTWLSRGSVATMARMHTVSSGRTESIGRVTVRSS